jgi:hypothetical protein
MNDLFRRLADDDAIAGGEGDEGIWQRFDVLDQLGVEHEGLAG